MREKNKKPHFKNFFQLLPTGVSIHLATPGFVDTPMLRASQAAAVSESSCCCIFWAGFPFFSFFLFLLPFHSSSLTPTNHTKKKRFKKRPPVPRRPAPLRRPLPSALRRRIHRQGDSQGNPLGPIPDPHGRPLSLARRGRRGGVGVGARGAPVAARRAAGAAPGAAGDDGALRDGDRHEEGPGKRGRRRGRSR